MTQSSARDYRSDVEYQIHLGYSSVLDLHEEAGPRAEWDMQDYPCQDAGASYGEWVSSEI